MIEDKITSVICHLTAIKHTNFTDNICIGLAQAIEANFVFIAKLNAAQSIATTLSVVKNGELVNNFSYSLKSTPCENTCHGNVCALTDNVQSLYPEDQLLVEMNIDGYVGIPLKNINGKTTAILVALFQNPIANIASVVSLFSHFSDLIKKEIETQAYIERLKLSNHIIEESKEAIIICNKQEQIVSVNKAFTEITGYRIDEVEGKNPSILNSQKQTANFYNKMWKNIKTKGCWTGEIWNKRKNGEIFPEWLSISVIYDDEGDISHYVGSFFDLSDKFKTEEKIYQQANFDLLTGLANRFFFLETLSQTIKSSTSNQSNSMIFRMDLDLFKEVNDLFGEQFGDELLVKVAHRLQSLIKKNDMAARISGDGFALLINNIINQSERLSITNKILLAFREPFNIQDSSINCTLSMGISLLPKEIKDASAVMKEAEHAMYHAKNNGRNSFSYFTQDMQHKVLQRLALKTDLESAISNNSLSVVYQPIISTHNLTVNKFEVLARWNNKGTWVSPEVFIPIAEEFMLIKAVGEFVLREACLQLKGLKSQGFENITFNVNRSVYEIPFDDKDNNKWLSTIIENGLEPSDICFELTESALAPEKRNNETLLKHLQSAGCTIALDDFGTGYSSLSYLRRFPIDFIKIDKSFVKDMTSDQDAKILVSTIISMAKALGKKIVAEGVETQEQLTQLSQLGCDLIQGYYFSKPMPAEDITNYLNDFLKPYSKISSLNMKHAYS